MRRIFWGFANLALSAVVLVIGYFAITNAQALSDWWKLRTYQPPANIVQLADATTMQGDGRNIFYASQPEVLPAEIFNRTCTDHGEESLVLGCYKQLRIYVFDVTDPQLSGVKEVTAAHEMLHGVYQRLTRSEKAELNQWLEAQLRAIQDDRLQKLIELYNEQEPGELLNEMHSILGTEYRNLSPELEKYYKRFFADRNKVVALSEGYESVFTASRQRIAALDAQLEGLKVTIDANNAELAVRERELSEDSAELNSLQRDDIAAYNQAVPGYNAKVREFNALATATRRLVEQYNAIVVQRNNEAAAQNDLYKGLDSHYQNVPAN